MLSIYTVEDSVTNTHMCTPVKSEKVTKCWNYIVHNTLDLS